MHSSAINVFVDQLFERNPLLKNIVNRLIEHTAQVYLVGGSVRDIVLERTINDLDIEVHGISLALLKSLLSEYGYVNSVGKSFGVLCLVKLAVDWSLPRKDGKGRHPAVIIDPTLNLQQAARRRDLTMNAMAINLLTKEFIDPFNGLDDIKNKILRTPDSTLFIEDPLRFYRVLQFIGRFEMMPDDQLSALCATMTFDTIAQERCMKELNKLFDLSKNPSKALMWLQKIGRLNELFVELDITEDNIIRGFKALDVAAHQTYKNSQERILIRCASLCHALKADSSDYKYLYTSPTNTTIQSVRHFFQKVTTDTLIINAGSLLVYYQTMPVEFIAHNAPSSAYKMLAYKLERFTTIEQLCMVASNVAQAQSCQKSINTIEQFKQNSIALNVYSSSEKPLLTGQDLLRYINAGKYLGDQLKKAYLLQINNDITNKEVLLSILEQYD